MALRSVSRPMPFAASACVSAWMRIAGRCPPESVTRPTPETWLIFCASRVLTRFCTSVSGSVSEVMARVSTGASAGLTLAYTGGAGRSAGSIERLAERELQRDDRDTGSARRAHPVQARHLAELAFQRRGHRVAHDLGT